jgi:glycosyltransferase involved in cell wall biosynthesis
VPQKPNMSVSSQAIVSIIMSNYNCAKYIGEAIESVQAQTYQNWELIIVDDCSTDGSVGLIHSYVKNDSRIRFYLTPFCSGSPAGPRNLALEKAGGRYIAFLDSDDVWLSHKLENQLEYLKNEKTAVVFSNYEKVAENGVRADRVIRSPAVVNYGKLLRGNCIGNLTAVYDTGKAGKITFQHFHHEDYVLWLTILQKGFIAENTNTVEALYRVRPGSVTSKKNMVIKWQWDIYRRQLKLSLLRSVYFFCFYVVNGFLKFIV